MHIISDTCDFCHLPHDHNVVLRVVAFVVSVAVSAKCPCVMSQIYRLVLQLVADTELLEGRLGSSLALSSNSVQPRPGLTLCFALKSHQHKFGVSDAVTWSSYDDRMCNSNSSFCG